MRRSRLLGTALAVVMATVIAACDVAVGVGHDGFSLAAAKAQDTWTRTYTLAPGGRLELINTNGGITAQSADGDAVEVSAERVASAGSEDTAKELLGKLEMREEAGPSQVRLEVRSPRHFGPGGVEVRWTVKVPRGVSVDLRNTNGKVALTGLGGDIRARTVNGGVEGRGLFTQALDASTVNGGVDVQFAEPLAAEGKVSLESVNGGVDLALPEESRASIVARVTNGGIRTSDLGVQTTGENTRRRFEGTLNGGGADVRVQTTNGGVRLSKSTS